MTGAHQRGKARAARRAAAKVAYTASAKLVTLIGGRNQTDHSTAHNQKKKSKVQNQRHEVHQKEDAERGLTQGKFENVQRKHRQRRGVNTHNRYQALGILDTIREVDEVEEPI